MGVPTSEVGYTSAMAMREDHEVHKRTCGGIGRKKNISSAVELLLFRYGNVNSFLKKNIFLQEGL